VFNQRKGYRLDISTSTNATSITRAPHTTLVGQTDQNLASSRLHLHQKNRCATTCQPQRQRQVIAKSNCYCIMSLCTASSKINCPAYLSSILHLLSSPCYCIPSTVLTCFLILCTSRDLKTQTNPASLVTPAPISLFPGMMAEEQPYTGTMSPGI